MIPVKVHPSVIIQLSPVEKSGSICPLSGLWWPNNEANCRGLSQNKPLLQCNDNHPGLLPDKRARPIITPSIWLDSLFTCQSNREGCSMCPHKLCQLWPQKSGLKTQNFSCFFFPKLDGVCALSFSVFQLTEYEILFGLKSLAYSSHISSLLYIDTMYMYINDDSIQLQLIFKNFSFIKLLFEIWSSLKLSSTQKGLRVLLISSVKLTKKCDSSLYDWQSKK